MNNTRSSRKVLRILLHIKNKYPITDEVLKEINRLIRRDGYATTLDFVNFVINKTQEGPHLRIDIEDLLKTNENGNDISLQTYGWVEPLAHKYDLLLGTEKIEGYLDFKDITKLHKKHSEEIY